MIMESNELSRREALRLSLLGVSAAALTGCADIKSPTSPPNSSQDTAKLALRDFLDLSQELTGIESLDSRLGAEHMKRYADNPTVGPYLQGLLAAYKSIKLLPPADQSAAWEARVLGPNAFFRPAAEQLVYLWYMSTFALRNQANP